MVRAPDGDLAGEQRDHAAGPPRARRARSGAPLAWQMATASASAAWSGARQVGQREQRLDHPLHLLLAGPARAADRALDLLGRVGEARDARAGPAASMTTPRACPTAKAERALAPK